MRNIEAKMEKGRLHLIVDLSKDFGPSKSGKTIIIASSEGNQKVDGTEDIKFGLNVYRKKQ